MSHHGPVCQFGLFQLNHARHVRQVRIAIGSERALKQVKERVPHEREHFAALRVRLGRLEIATGARLLQQSLPLLLLLRRRVGGHAIGHDAYLILRDRLVQFLQVLARQVLAVIDAAIVANELVDRHLFCYEGIVCVRVEHDDLVYMEGA